MTGLQAILLGLIQGLTEFLPVSSSGHLVLAQHWLGFAESVIVFDVLLHFSTLMAVVIFFARDLIRLTKKRLLVLLVASIPAGLAGFFLADLVESLFVSVNLVAFMLLVTGGFNLLSNWKLKQEVDEKQEISFKQGLVIGFFQSLALIPGISRSGSTVFAGLFQGLDRLQAFRFSFILSLPAILGATFLQIIKLDSGQLSSLFSGPYLLGAVSAFIAGLCSLYLFKLVMKRANLSYFGYYCLLLGSVSLIWWF